MKTTKSFFEYEPPVRRQSGLITRALLILPPAFLLSLKYDLPHILILTSLMVVFPIFQDRSFRLRDRPVIYSLLAAGILAVVPGLLVKIPDERLTFSDYLMRSHQFLPFLLYASAISCWFMRTREISALCLLIVLLSCLACGDVYNTSKLVNTSFAGTTQLLRHYRETYMVCTVLQCIGTLLILTADVRYDSVDHPRSVLIARILSILLLFPGNHGTQYQLLALGVLLVGAALLNGYTKPDGIREPSADEKIARGKQAIAALQAYRQAKADGNDAEAQSQLQTFRENEQYFGYGYVKDKHQLVPPIGLNFYAFRIMVGVGCLLILFFGLLLMLAFKVPFFSVFTRRLLSAIGLMPETQADVHGASKMPRWLYWAAIIMVPLAYIASESGWLVAELGRQPWTIQDMLPTWVAVSDIEGFSVALTFFLFLFLFTLMLAVEISILLKQIKKGPEYSEPASE